MTNRKSSTSPSILDLMDELSAARSLAHAIELAAEGMLMKEDGSAIEVVCHALQDRLDRIADLAETLGRAEAGPELRTEH